MKTLGLGFDALYSGFLGAFEQLEIVGQIFDMLKCSGTDMRFGVNFEAELPNLIKAMGLWRYCFISS